MALYPPRRGWERAQVYVGRWSLLEGGIEWVYEATKTEVLTELAKETEEWNKTHKREDKRIGVYTLEEFQAEFNEDLNGSFNTKTYWIKFF